MAPARLPTPPITHHDENFNRLPEREVVRGEVAHLVRVERPGQAGDKGGDDEAFALEERHPNAAGTRGIGVLANGIDRTSEARTLDAREGKVEERRHPDVEAVA